MRVIPLICALFLALPAAAAGAEEPKPWRETRYNPKALLDDLILPMPCGGAMAFRKVVTPHAEGALSDVAIEIGGEAAEKSYLRGRRKAFVSGPFQDQDGFRAYYMAKYEISAPQYLVVMSETCPDKRFRKADFVPAAQINWFDAVAFTQRYSTWLHRNARAEMIAELGLPAYLRLPTEAEWEYAARGGAAVTTAEFREPVYPLGTATLAEFEAYGATSSANGKVQPVGSLSGNPLGLHDMLGNVAELMLEPFRPVRHGRSHGRIGGFVKRGGDANADLSQITAVTRQELLYFDETTGAPLSSKFIGFRPVISALAIGTEQDRAAYEDASRNAAAPDLQRELGTQEAKALADLEAAARIEDPRTRRTALTEIALTLDAARAERNRQRDRAIESLFLAAASTCNTAVQQIRNLRFARRQEEKAVAELEKIRRLRDEGNLTAEELAELPKAEEAVARIIARNSARAERIQGHLDTYAEFIATLQADYGPDVTDAQADLLRKKLGDEGRSVLLACLGLSSAHLDGARADGRLRTGVWLAD
ncbi:MAG: SUMF1/EgtB/PvdO family nonheme iron enzyme, partial [Pseudomonadota bacterium]